MGLSSWFWSESVWLPPGITFADLSDFESKGNRIAKASDLYWLPVYSICVLIVRYLFEKFIAVPLANIMGIKVGTENILNFILIKT